ncbi:MAG: CheR family methyltransferase [Desulfomonilaceae bacterium]
MTDSELLKFCDFIRDEVGLDFPPKKWGLLKRSLSYGAASQGFKSVTEFVRWITQGLNSEKRVDILVRLLAIGETFFFRDQKTFEGIDKVIIPEIISSKSDSIKTFRIWSAGCSTGEETYSIAILLKRSLLASLNWQIEILGTDINRESLKKAKLGFYKEWSFRGAPTWLKDGYFSKVAGGYELNSTIKAMVQFHPLNLASFDYSKVLQDFGPVDLMLCRNTMMYFAEGTRKRIIENALLWMNNGGWIILSPTEMPHVVHHRLRLVTLPGAIFFRLNSGRSETGQEIEDSSSLSFKGFRTSSQKIGPLKNIKLQNENSFSTLRSLPASRLAKAQVHENDLVIKQKSFNAFCALKRSDYNETLSILGDILLNNETESLLIGNCYYLQARAYANLGLLEQAHGAIENATKIDKLNVAYHYISSCILLARGMIEEASARLEKVLFLDPDHIMANVTQATIQIKLNNKQLALRHIRNALRSIDSLEPNEIVPDSDGATVTHIREMINSALVTMGEKMELFRKTLP